MRWAAGMEASTAEGGGKDEEGIVDVREEGSPHLEVSTLNRKI